MIKTILEICVVVVGLLFILTAVGIVCYEILIFEEPRPDYISEEMWEFLNSQTERAEHDASAYKKVAKAKKKEYKKYARESLI